MEIVRARHVVIPAGVLSPGEVTHSGGRIVAVGPARPDVPMWEGWLVPGFVDVHCHGALGVDFSAATPDDARRAVAFHRDHGTTTMLASTVTGSLDDVQTAVDMLATLVAADDLAGVHLEGPCLAASRCGAHDAGLLIDPSHPGFAEICAHRAVQMVTLAPELLGGLDAVAQLSRQGVVVAIGHTDADADLTRQAIDAGARVATHLFNAMPGIHHRSPGPIPTLLADPRVACELIMDGEHVAPDVLRLAVAASAGTAMMITDAMSATGMPDGSYQIGHLPVTVDAGVAKISGTDTLAGSTLTMSRAFAYAVQHVGLDIAVVARMAATVPARALGLKDVGELAPGAWADACVVSDSGELRGVMRRGSWRSPTNNAEISVGLPH